MCVSDSATWFKDSAVKLIMLPVCSSYKTDKMRIWCHREEDSFPLPCSTGQTYLRRVTLWITVIFVYREKKMVLVFIFYSWVMPRKKRV